MNKNNINDIVKILNFVNEPFNGVLPSWVKE